MSEDLLRCPFCGGEAGLGKEDSDPQHLRWFSQCYDCYVSTMHHINKSDAIAAWNTRASQWREISDSQKDGNIILGTGPEIGTHVIWWNSEPTLGGYTWRISESAISLHEDAITHWQPLPQPPVSK